MLQLTLTVFSVDNNLFPLLPLDSKANIALDSLDHEVV